MLDFVGRLTADVHGISGVLAIVLMAVHAVWASVVLARRDVFSTAYESKLAAAFSDPAGWTRNVAQALDYQFGFKVSDTGLFRLLQRALLPVIPPTTQTELKAIAAAA